MEKIFSRSIYEKIKLLRDYSVIIVDGNAGMGKTTLFQNEMKKRTDAVIYWYTATHGVQDYSLFWFLDKLVNIDPVNGQKLSEYRKMTQFNVSDIAEICKTISCEKETYIVFDDFQNILMNWDLGIFQAIANRKTDGLHVIILTRYLGRLRNVINNEKKFLRIESWDFLFQEEDVIYFAKLHNKLIDVLTAQKIIAVTHGWPVAVKLFFDENEFEDKALSFDTFDFNQSKKIFPFLQTPAMGKGKTNEQIYKEAGQWYMQHNHIKDAIECFFQIRDYGGILSCELSGLMMTQFEDNSYLDIIMDIYQYCEDEQLLEYPISALRVCYHLFGYAKFDEYERLIGRLHELITYSNDQQLLGEWWLVKAFSYFPNLEKMKECYEKAEGLMNKVSQIFTKKEPFMYGSTSMWYLFHREQGKMLETATKFEETMEVYNRLTDGHGSGAACLYFGEVYCVRGEYDESEIYAYKASFLAEKTENISIIYGVSHLLGVNSIYQSNMQGFEDAIRFLDETSKKVSYYSSKAINQYMIESVRAHLLALVMETQKSVLWSSGDADQMNNLIFVNYMVKTTCVTDMMLKGEYRKAIASIESFLLQDERLISLPTKNIMNIGLALCYLIIGKVSIAAQHLDTSLSLIALDKNYTFIAAFRKQLGVLFLLPSISSKHEKTIREIRKFNIAYKKVEKQPIFDLLEMEGDVVIELTGREYEVARLAAKGMRNKEIGAVLCISDETVKDYMKSIFKKLGVDRRSSLSEIIK